MTMPNPQSQIHRLEPIRKGLAESWKISNFGHQKQQKNSYIGFKPRKLRYAITPQMDLLAKGKTDPQFKSP
jgi:hypothetical protein